MWLLGKSFAVARAAIAGRDGFLLLVAAIVMLLALVFVAGAAYVLWRAIAVLRRH